MSFVDLAAIATHRHHELEARIKEFNKKCDFALQNVIKLQMKAQGFLEQLKCDPTELKERFLSCMKQLDEFTYIITDFNLAICKSDETSIVEYTPVQDIKNKAIQPSPINGTLNLLDALSEPSPSTSKICQNQCPFKSSTRKKIPKEEQLLIAFSSASCSSESLQMMKTDKVEREIHSKSVESNVTDEDQRVVSPYPDSSNLPAQSVLPVDCSYEATIMHVDGSSFWVITKDFNDVCNMMMEMMDYYTRIHVELNMDQLTALTYCAYYDDDTDCYYRALVIRLAKDTSQAELFLVDTGEVRVTCVRNVQPLAAQFCTHPPFARCCHLAGVDVIGHSEQELMEKQEELIKKYKGTICTIHVDDNSSESLGVYVTLQSGEQLNDTIVKLGVADKNQTEVSHGLKEGPPEICDADLDILDEPEYDDPVEAVTGYHNRDEMDICKHYKGGPEKTCFKGSRCTKKHILKNPDGWTQDQVSVVANLRALPLPAPDSWLRFAITCVPHYDRFYGHLVTEIQKKEPVPRFGVVLPPKTLEGLVRDMNSPATVLSYKSLTIAPAPGELVAALYPLDGQWYRAQVERVTLIDQNVEVQYIDYGNTMCVKDNEIRALPERYAALPAQAVRCALAGVRARTACSRVWADARGELSKLINGRTVDIHVIAREYSEITVEVFDKDGFNISEQLVATCPQLELTEYSVIDDAAIPKLVVD